MDEIVNREEIDLSFKATQKGDVPARAGRVAQMTISGFNLRKVVEICIDQGACTLRITKVLCAAFRIRWERICALRLTSIRCRASSRCCPESDRHGLN